MPRKLCYICEATQGGVRTHLNYLVKHFARKNSGYEVSALVGDRGEPGFSGELQEWRENGINVRTIDLLTRNPSPGKDWSAYGELKKILREIQPEIVHTHSSKAGFLGRAAAWSVKIPKIVHTPHVFAFQWAMGLSGSIYTRMERWAAKRCHHLICVAEAQRELAVQYGLDARAKISVIPNGVPVLEDQASFQKQRAHLREEFGWDADTCVIGVVTRMAPQKDNRTLLEAARLTLKAEPKVRFAILGSGEQEEEIRKLAQASGLKEPELNLVGYQDAGSWYPTFDILAFSSLYEGLPYVLLEASAAGLPVVASDVMGVREIIKNGESGLLVPTGNAQALADQLLKLAKDKVLREKLGSAARERIRTGYALETFLQRHEAVYSAP